MQIMTDFAVDNALTNHIETFFLTKAFVHRFRSNSFRQIIYNII